MRLKVRGALDRKKLRRFSKQFGDTSKGALIRLAVAMSREAATLTAPRGRSKKKLNRSIMIGAKINVVGMDARGFNRAKANGAFSYKRRRVSLRDDQILETPSDVHSFIESARGANGRTRKYPLEQKAIAKSAVLNKTIAQRRRLAGIAKGSWLGAGQVASRAYRGPDRPRIAPSFMKWAQKHLDKGTARVRHRMLGKSHVLLISKAYHTKSKGVFPTSAVRAAGARALKNTISWYRRQVKRNEKKP